MTQRRTQRVAEVLRAAVVAVSLSVSCGGSPGDDSPRDGSPADGSPGELAPADLATADLAPADGSPEDLAPADSSPGDLSPADLALADTPREGGGCTTDGDCTDGNPCNGSESCREGGCVAGTPVECVGRTCHSIAVCNPSTGQCEDQPLADGTKCDDKNACTTADACVAGSCTGQPVTCPEADSCHREGACSPSTGLCSAGPAKTDGEACDDGNPCSTTSSCSSGTCVATSTLPDDTDCDDQDVCSLTSTCQSGRCAPVSSAPDDTPCNDGSACTFIDTCRSGRCQGNHAPMCSTTPNMCPLPGSCVPSCGDGVLAATEACDSGTTAGAGCTPDCRLEGTPHDYDVSGVGSVFAVYMNTGKLMGRCFSPSGAARGPAFEIASGTFAWAQVVTARDSGHSLVSYAASAGSGTWLGTPRLYDAACQPVDEAFTWTAQPRPDTAFDTAIDASGNSVVLWTQYDAGSSSASLAFYDATGKQQGSTLLVDSESRCQSSYAMRVVVSPTTGFGVVTCQEHAADPIYYRRFHDGAFTDTTMLEVPGTLGHSSWYQSHAVGMNDAGDFLVVWQDYDRRSYEAAIFSSLLGHSKSFSLGWDLSEGYDGFPRGTRSIQLYGSDFAVLAGSGSNSIARLVSSSGTVRGCDTAEGRLLRTGGVEISFTINNGIQRNSVDFSTWNGCSRPTCGNGTRDAGEQCDDDDLESFDGCNEYCQTERCGDGLVTDGESCDDGVQLPTSTCSSTCQLTANTPAVVESYPSGTLDFDVASDGSVVDTWIDDGRVWVRCYGPDRKPLRQAFPVSPLRAHLSAKVVVGWSSKRAVVAWHQGGQLWGTLLDGQCQRVTAPMQLLSSSIDDESWEVAMDGTGRFAAVTHGSDGQVHIGLFDEAGSRLGPEHVTAFSKPVYGIHVAMNRVSGGGVVTAQEHSGAGAVFYRRFGPSGSWTDPGFAVVPVDMVYWYDGHTVGMNGQGEFVVMYRGDNGAMKAVFYSASAEPSAPVVFSTRVRTGDTMYYDSFRNYRPAIPLKGNNFVLGEVYRSADGAADRTTSYFVYTAAGTPVSTYESQWSDGQFKARLDGNGVSYFLANRTVFFGASRL